MTWPRDDFARAVWESDLSTSQKLVALAYADHARAGDTAWIDYDRLMQRVSCSRDTVARTIKALREAGWLAVAVAAGQHKSARYRLQVPGQRSDDLTTDAIQESDDRTTEGQQSDDAAQQSDPAVSAVRSSDPTTTPHLSPEGERGERVRTTLSADQVEAVARIVDSGALGEEHAIVAVQSIARARKQGDPIRNWPAFLATIGSDGLERHAGLRPGVTAPGAPTNTGEFSMCDHGKWGGMRQLAGERHCHRCQDEHPPAIVNSQRATA